MAHLSLTAMDTSKHGITQLYRGNDPTVDIVAVHGLRGHSLKTWTAGDRSIPWLQEFLPRAVPNARILTWGYDATVVKLLGSTSSDHILHHAQTLVSQLHADRSVSIPCLFAFPVSLLAKKSILRIGQIEGATDRPLIFVCHSLGGIVVKRVRTPSGSIQVSVRSKLLQAIAYSKSRTSSHVCHLHQIYTCTYAILFLGTPHQGSSIANTASSLQRLVKVLTVKMVIDTDTHLLSALKQGSETLQDISDQFAPMMKRFRIFFFWEQQKTSLPHTREYVGHQDPCAVPS